MAKALVTNLESIIYDVYLQFTNSLNQFLSINYLDNK